MCRSNKEKMLTDMLQVARDDLMVRSVIVRDRPVEPGSPIDMQTTCDNRLTLTVDLWVNATGFMPRS